MVFFELSPVELIAFLFAVLGVVKIAVISVNKMGWFNYVAKPIYGHPRGSGIVFLVLAGIILYFLLQELTIVQIFASFALTSLLVGLGFMAFPKELTKVIEKIYKNKFSPLLWIYTLIWLAFILWVIYNIFAY